MHDWLGGKHEEIGAAQSSAFLLSEDLKIIRRKLDRHQTAKVTSEKELSVKERAGEKTLIVVPCLKAIEDLMALLVEAVTSHH
jgi:hypothetical protein